MIQEERDQKVAEFLSRTVSEVTNHFISTKILDGFSVDFDYHGTKYRLELYKAHKPLKLQSLWEKMRKLI